MIDETTPGAVKALVRACKLKESPQKSHIVITNNNTHTHTHSVSYSYV